MIMFQCFDHYPFRSQLRLKEVQVQDKRKVNKVIVSYSYWNPFNVEITWSWNYSHFTLLFRREFKGTDSRSLLVYINSLSLYETLNDG